MLEVTHKNFKERLGGFGIISLLEKKFWQWTSAHASMASRSKSSYFGPYLAVSLQNEVFKKSQSWIGVF